MTAWNGLDELTPDEVLALHRPDAARWWRECVDPEGLGAGLLLGVAEIDELAIALGHDGPGWLDAYLHAAECAGVLA